MSARNEASAAERARRTPAALQEWSAEDRRVIAEWIEAQAEPAPEAVRRFLALHHRYLVAGDNLPKAFQSVLKELRRALHLTPSSEKRRRSGSLVAAIPEGPKGKDAKSAREKIEDKIQRSHDLAKWHRDLKKAHNRRAKRLKEKLAKMPTENKDESARRPTPEPLEDIELTPEEIAESEAAADLFAEHLRLGTDTGADASLTSVNETLMPSGAVLVGEERVPLPVQVPEDLANAQVIKTISDPRVRYDFSMAVTRIVLDVEKKVLVDENGDRHVITAPTIDHGPPRYAVTWNALATLAVMVAQFALPLNRLSTLLSTPEKRFTAGGLSRMLHFVAERLLPLYLELGRRLGDSDYLAGDDTSCRVIEVSAYNAKVKADPAAAKREPPPWNAYATPRAAKESLRLCEVARNARERRREDGDRTATRTAEETPTIGMLIGRELPFESLRRNGDGPKEAMHVTVISGRSDSADPRSLIIFYRSHIGSCGNLLEAILHKRDPKRQDLILQGDLSTTNLVPSAELRSRFNIRMIACYAHARRPFALYEEDDPERCEQMLHLFLGLAIYEQSLDSVGRNRENVLAVRGGESREIWNEIRELATTMTNRWSKATNLGTAARYIINHFSELTAYLDDARLEPSNNMRERMLRTEKLIEASSMFRRTLEGRFVLDVVRTVLQTAVAAGAPVHEYLLSVLRADPDEVAKDPSRFTPRAWIAANQNATPPATAPPATT